MATNGGNDPMVLLAARLESLETALTRDGIKCVQVPATANPGECGALAEAAQGAQGAGFCLGAGGAGAAVSGRIPRGIRLAG